MKKIFILILFVSLFSCENDDDVQPAASVEVEEETTDTTVVYDFSGYWQYTDSWCGGSHTAEIEQPSDSVVVIYGYVSCAVDSNTFEGTWNSQTYKGELVGDSLYLVASQSGSACADWFTKL